MGNEARILLLSLKFQVKFICELFGCLFSLWPAEAIQVFLGKNPAVVSQPDLERPGRLGVTHMQVRVNGLLSIGVHGELHEPLTTKDHPLGQQYGDQDIVTDLASCCVGGNKQESTNDEGESLK